MQEMFEKNICIQFYTTASLYAKTSSKRKQHPTVQNGLPENRVLHAFSSSEHTIPKQEKQTYTY